MKLRHNPASPYVRKVMVCAHELGLAGKIELLSTAVSPVETNATLAAENPLMKIPALVTDDGQVLFDSPVICEYLDSLAGGGKVFPAPGNARWAALRQQALGDGILDALILCRYEIAARPEEKRHAAWTDGQMKKAHQALPHWSARICRACARSGRSPPAAPSAISTSASPTTAGAPATPSSPRGTRGSRHCPRCRRPSRRRASPTRLPVD
jgi:glutathione S-transferase